MPRKYPEKADSSTNWPTDRQAGPDTAAAQRPDELDPHSWKPSKRQHRHDQKRPFPDLLPDRSRPRHHRRCDEHHAHERYAICGNSCNLYTSCVFHTPIIDAYTHRPPFPAANHSGHHEPKAAGCTPKTAGCTDDQPYTAAARAETTPRHSRVGRNDTNRAAADTPHPRFRLHSCLERPNRSCWSPCSMHRRYDHTPGTSRRTKAPPRPHADSALRDCHRRPPRCNRDHPPARTSTDPRHVASPTSS